jgi:hypothetical protein
MIYMKILKKGGSREKGGGEETKSMPHAPVNRTVKRLWIKNKYMMFSSDRLYGKFQTQNLKNQ